MDEDHLAFNQRLKYAQNKGDDDGGGATVADLMVTDVFTLYESDSLRSVEVIMGFKKIHHIPVIDKNRKVLGIITHRDLLEAARQLFGEVARAAKHKVYRGVEVKQIMKTDLVKVSPSMPLHQASQLMFEKKIGCLVVEEKHKLVGILTPSDFLRLCADKKIMNRF